MDVVATKVLVLVFLAIIKLGSGLLPVLLDKVLQVKKVIYIKWYVSHLVSASIWDVIRRYWNYLCY